MEAVAADDSTGQRTGVEVTQLVVICLENSADGGEKGEFLCLPMPAASIKVKNRSAPLSRWEALIAGREKPLREAKAPARDDRTSPEYQCRVKGREEPGRTPEGLIPVTDHRAALTGGAVPAKVPSHVAADRGGEALGNGNRQLDANQQALALAEAVQTHVRAVPWKGTHSGGRRS